MTINPITALSEKIQKRYGQNIQTRVVGKEGQDHCPTISVEIELPDGTIFKASGLNQRETKQKAAQQALDSLTEDLL